MEGGEIPVSNMIEESYKYIERRGLEKPRDPREPEKEKFRQKEGKSPFDEVLEQGRRLTQGTLNARGLKVNAETKESPLPMEKFKEKIKERSEEREKEEDRKKESREEKRETTDPSHKVVGKGSGKKNEGGSSGGGEKGERGLAGQKGRKLFAKASMRNSDGALHQINGKRFSRAFGEKLGLNKQFPKTLPQEVLNHIVRYVRIGLNQKGEKEIALDLHQNVFKGLRLRLSSNHGKVKIHFLAADGAVRLLFSKEKEAILEALSKKGIAVEEILVT